MDVRGIECHYLDAGTSEKEQRIIQIFGSHMGKARASREYGETDSLATTRSLLLVFKNFFTFLGKSIVGSIESPFTSDANYCIIMPMDQCCWHRKLSIVKVNATFLAQIFNDKLLLTLYFFNI